MAAPSFSVLGPAFRSRCARRRPAWRPWAGRGSWAWAGRQEEDQRDFLPRARSGVRRAHVRGGCHVAADPQPRVCVLKSGQGLEEAILR